MNKQLKQLFRKIGVINQKGSALIAVLILIPVLTAGGVAVYTANSPADYTLTVTAEDKAIYAAQSGITRVVNNIFNDPDHNPAQSPEARMAALLKDSVVGGVVGGDDGIFKDFKLPTPNAGDFGDVRTYQALTSRFRATWESVNSATPSIRVVAQVFNNAAAVFGAGNHLAEFTLIQTFSTSSSIAPTVTGCAINYDYWAGRDYNQFVGFGFAGNEVYYTGRDWQITGFSIGASQYIDAVDTAYKKLFMFPVPICFLSKVACDFTPILTFGSAIGPQGYGSDGKPNTDKDVNWINVCGDSGDEHCGYPTNGYDDSKLPYEQSYEARILAKVTNNKKLTTSIVTSKYGQFHFLDENKNNIPDSPYFYYAKDDGGDLDLDDFNQLDTGLFRNKEVFIYVKGSINSFDVNDTKLLSFKKLNIIAKNDIRQFSMTSEALGDSGVNFVAGRDFISNSALSLSGFSNVTIMANHDIIKNNGLITFKINGRSRFVAGNDIKISSGFTFDTTKRSGDPDQVCDKDSTAAADPILTLGMQYPI